MKKKLKILNEEEEIKRAHDTLLRGSCFVSKIPLHDQPYDLIWHTGAQSWVFVSKVHTNLQNS